MYYYSWWICFIRAIVLLYITAARVLCSYCFLSNNSLWLYNAASQRVFLIFAKIVVSQRLVQQRCLFKKQSTCVNWKPQCFRLIILKGAHLSRFMFMSPCLYLCSPVSSVLSLQEWQEPTGGWLWRKVQVDARGLRKKPELTTSFIFKYPRDIGGGSTEDWRVKGSGITPVNFV